MVRSPPVGCERVGRDRAGPVRAGARLGRTGSQMAVSAAVPGVRDAVATGKARWSRTRRASRSRRGLEKLKRTHLGCPAASARRVAGQFGGEAVEGSLPVSYSTRNGRDVRDQPDPEQRPGRATGPGLHWKHERRAHDRRRGHCCRCRGHGGLGGRRLRAASGVPRSAPGFVYLQLAPNRIQVWKGPAEFSGRTVMRAGVWLDDSTDDWPSRPPSCRSKSYSTGWNSTR
jgi:hypothetical protein